MRNVLNNLVKEIQKNNNIAIYTLKNQQDWLITRRIGEKQYNLSLARPLDNIEYNIGTVNQETLQKIITEMIIQEIAKNLTMTQKLKKFKNILQKYNQKSPT